jgi:hypothetical protein
LFLMFPRLVNASICPPAASCSKEQGQHRIRMKSLVVRSCGSCSLARCSVASASDSCHCLHLEPHGQCTRSSAESHSLNFVTGIPVPARIGDQRGGTISRDSWFTSSPIAAICAREKSGSKTAFTFLRILAGSREEKSTSPLGFASAA